VRALPAVAGYWDPPEDLGPDGKDLWDCARAEGVVWLAATDRRQLVEACRASDASAKAWQRYMVTGDPRDNRAWATATKEVRDHLSALGFNPTSRTRLGVAEVKKQSALEELVTRRSRGK
jgi:hypothetical protein